ncbi:MAG TPA: M55 family metallopeptidase [Plantibacter sp.]|uniref:M55 family metallopeptidase n=1 Tax=Plantibacter sp. TaxID=1871045 RepID=UPI002B5EC465|nr:M55 family metallopeptidase [Plantibacter sp.]
MKAILATLLAVACFGTHPSAQDGRKVFISADMEGISGISGSDQLSATGAEYGRSRKMMADDVNAAIRGARAGGATTIVVNDSHGSSVVRDVRVNGTSMGEGGLNTTVAAWYGVPVVLVTGDDVAVRQVAEIATTAKTVAVKRAINPRAVELRSFKDVHRMIENAAREGVAGARKFPPRREASYRVEVQFNDVTIPEVAENLPGFQRPAPDTIAFTQDSMPKAYTLIRLLYRYINPD